MGVIVVWLVFIGAVAIGALYIAGIIILRRQGHQWMGIPMQYDGKGPYEQWAENLARVHHHQWEEFRDPDGPFVGVLQHRCINGLCGMGGIGSAEACTVSSHRHTSWAKTMQDARATQMKEEDK